MTIFHVILFSLIEGITEFLPVSSTGHLILAADLLQLPQTDVQKSFAIAIQSGAILAVVALYGRTLLRDARTLRLVAVAFLPTAVIGFLLHGVVKRLLLGNATVVLWALLLGGVALLVFERFRPRRDSALSISSISFTQAVLVGVYQSIAIVPGVSRSAATIVGGELLGIGRRAIVEFTFLLAIPTMLAATGYDLLTSASAFTAADWRALLLGFVLSFLIALAAIRWFITYIQRNSFAVFGWYRILLALFFFLFWK